MLCKITKSASNFREREHTSLVSSTKKSLKLLWRKFFSAANQDQVMESPPERLEPSLAAYIGDWTWTIPNFETWVVSMPDGHIEESPVKHFVVGDHKFSFSYRFQVGEQWGRCRLINRSKMDVRLTGNNPPYNLILRPGEDCNFCWMTFDLEGDVDGIFRNRATIMIDYDEESPLQRDLLSLFKNPNDSDFTLLCEDEKFSCHKCILKARSPVLAAALEATQESNELIEFRVDSDSFKVRPDSVKQILEFIYSDSISGDVDADLLKLADYFNIQGLVKLCQNRMADTITEDNFFSLLTLAESISEGKILKKTVMDFIVENYQVLKETADWQKLTIRQRDDIMDIMFAKL